MRVAGEVSAAQRFAQLFFSFAPAGHTAETLLLPKVVDTLIAIMRDDQHPLITLHALLTVEMFCKTREWCCASLTMYCLAPVFSFQAKPKSSSLQRGRRK